MAARAGRTPSAERAKPTFAIEGGRLDAARLLIDRGADPAPDGRTLADLAAARGHAAIRELLKLRRR